MRSGFAAVLLLFALGLGCGGPRKGDVYAVPWQALLYKQEGQFREAAERSEAGVPSPGMEVHARVEAGEIVLLPKGARVKVVEPARGGAKVVGLDGRWLGLVGWLRQRDLSGDDGGR